MNEYKELFKKAVKKLNDFDDDQLKKFIDMDFSKKEATFQFADSTEKSTFGINIHQKNKRTIEYDEIQLIEKVTFEAEKYNSESLMQDDSITKRISFIAASMSLFIEKITTTGNNKHIKVVTNAFAKPDSESIEFHINTKPDVSDLYHETRITLKGKDAN